MIAFRCDGDASIGAGHVARCVRLAEAFRDGGHEVVLCGAHEGVAGDLIERSGLPQAAATGDGPLGVPGEASAVVVDSYEIPPAEMEAAASGVPLAAVVDDGPVPAATAVISYHLDSAERIPVPAGTTGLLGPAFAPASPAMVAARRPRALSTALVTAGGGETGLALAASAAETLLALDDELQVFVAAPGSPPTPHPRLSWCVEPGLDARIAWADIAVSAAGSTPYDLICAGVPTALQAVAPNQVPIERAFLAARVATGAAEDLLEPDVRTQLAAAGTAMVDGYGSHRVRDGLLAAFAGRPPAPPVRYRPATEADAELLLRWRNDEEVRAVSRTSDPIAPEDHARWLAEVIADGDRTLWMAEEDGAAVATVRFDRAGATSEISVTVAPGARGGGRGSRIIAETSELELAARPDVGAVLAEVQVRNLGSLAAFQRAGFARSGTASTSDNAVLTRTRAATCTDPRIQEHS